MASDAQKNYKRALKRVEDALDAFNKAKGIFEVKRSYRELEFAIVALHTAKVNLLRESEERER
jgi:hypothetical protein